MKNFRGGEENGNSDQLSGGDFDYERAKRAVKRAVHVNLYTGTYQLFPDKGKALADSLINMVAGIASISPTNLQLAIPWRTFRKISKMENFFTDGNGKRRPVGDDLKNVQYFSIVAYATMTLTHSKDNKL